MMKKDPQTVKHCLTSVQSKWVTPEIILSLLLVSPTSNFISVYLLTANTQFYQLLLPLHTKYLKPVFPSVLGDRAFFLLKQHIALGIRQEDKYLCTNLDWCSLSLNFYLQPDTTLELKITRKLQTDLMFLFYYLYVLGIDDHINTHVRLEVPIKNIKLCICQISYK